MTNKNESGLVIRWLDGPMDAACALCKSGKKKNFKKGPVVSLVNGDVVCSKCAAMHDRNLWNVCSNYVRHLAEYDLEKYDLERGVDYLPVDNINLKESLNLEKYDEAFPEMNKYDDHLELKYDDPLLNKADKCAGCAYTYQPKSDPKRK